MPTLINTAKSLPFIRVTTLEQTQQQLQIAKNTGKPVFLDFYADWCSTCRELDDTVFANPKVATALTSYILIRADVTEDNDQIKALQKYFNVVAPPVMIFFNKSGNEVKSARMVGGVTAKEFLAAMPK
jgi:thiol:disulfide interchange protein DsbD